MSILLKTLYHILAINIEGEMPQKAELSENYSDRKRK